jgi:hypothetical protein
MVKRRTGTTPLTRASTLCTCLVLSFVGLLGFAASAGAGPLDEIASPVEETVAPVKEAVETVTPPVVSAPPAPEAPAPVPATPAPPPAPTPPPPPRSPAPVNDVVSGLESSATSAGEVARHTVESSSETAVRTTANTGAAADGARPTGGASSGSGSPGGAETRGNDRRAPATQPNVPDLAPRATGGKKGDGPSIASPPISFPSPFIFVWPAIALGGPLDDFVDLDRFLSTWSRATLALFSEYGTGSLRGEVAPAAAAAADAALGPAVSVSHSHSPFSFPSGPPWIPGSGGASVLLYLLFLALAGLAIAVIVRRRASEEKEPHG